MENKKLPNCLKECKAGMSNLIDYRFITLSVSISLSGVELHWTLFVCFISIVSKLFNSRQQEFDISKDFHLCAFMTQYKAYGIIRSMYIRIS